MNTFDQEDLKPHSAHHAGQW